MIGFSISCNFEDVLCESVASMLFTKFLYGSNQEIDRPY